MSNPLCERASLVEASFDGRLGPAEQASMNRHLATCLSCTELHHDLTALRDDLRASTASISQLDHQRARLRLLRRAASPSGRKRRPVALVSAVLVMAPVAVWAAASSVSSLHGYASDGAAAASTSEPQRAPAKVAPIAPVPTTAVEEAPDTPATSRDAPPPIPMAAPVLASSSIQRAGAPARSLGPLPSTATAMKGGASTTSAEFADAMDAVARGDFRAGAIKLERFAEAHPTDPRAEEALYLEAIAYERAGRISDARSAAKRYLASYPTGAHRAHALRLAGDGHESQQSAKGLPSTGE